MATAISKLEKKVEASLKSKFGPVQAETREGEQPVAIGWELLIGPIIDVILSLLDGCLAKRSREQIAENAMRDNPYTRFAIKVAVRRSNDIEREMNNTAREVVQDVMTDSTKEEVEELVKEFNQERIEWDLFA